MEWTDAIQEARRIKRNNPEKVIAVANNHIGTGYTVLPNTDVITVALLRKRGRKITLIYRGE